jgi:exopolysaccharide biosynthesis WecB/TagA/CpsF family protein
MSVTPAFLDTANCADLEQELVNNSSIEQAIAKLAIINCELEVSCLLEQLVTPDRPTVVSFINQHAVCLSAADPAFIEALLASDLLLRDGVAMKALLWTRGRRAGLNMNGTDFIPRLLRARPTASVAFYGSTTEWLQRAAASARQITGSQSISIMDGFRATNAYVARAKAERPDIIVLGMGMPKQEIVARRLREALDYPCLIVCGGAILDFLGGRFPRAPKIIRRLGLEWLHRLALEPKRLWRRYFVGGAGFLNFALGAR